MELTKLAAGAFADVAALPAELTKLPTGALADVTALPAEVAGLATAPAAAQIWALTVKTS